MSLSEKYGSSIYLSIYFRLRQIVCLCQRSMALGSMNVQAVAPGRIIYTVQCRMFSPFSGAYIGGEEGPLLLQNSNIFEKIQNQYFICRGPFVKV